MDILFLQVFTALTFSFSPLYLIHGCSSACICQPSQLFSYPYLSVCHKDSLDMGIFFSSEILLELVKGKLPAVFNQLSETFRPTTNF